VLQKSHIKLASAFEEEERRTLLETVEKSVTGDAFLARLEEIAFRILDENPSFPTLSFAGLSPVNRYDLFSSCFELFLWSEKDPSSLDESDLAAHVQAGEELRVRRLIHPISPHELNLPVSPIDRAEAAGRSFQGQEGDRRRGREERARPKLQTISRPCPRRRRGPFWMYVLPNGEVTRRS
jgi:hypothetical protein